MKKYFIFLPAFYPIMCLMKSPKNFEKIVILKIWPLVSFWGVKTHLGEIPLKRCIFRNYIFYFPLLLQACSNFKILHNEMLILQQKSYPFCTNISLFLVRILPFFFWDIFLLLIGTIFFFSFFPFSHWHVILFLLEFFFSFSSWDFFFYMELSRFFFINLCYFFHNMYFMIH